MLPSKNMIDEIKEYLKDEYDGFDFINNVKTKKGYFIDFAFKRRSGSQIAVEFIFGEKYHKLASQVLLIVASVLEDYGFRGLCIGIVCFGILWLLSDSTK